MENIIDGRMLRVTCVKIGDLRQYQGRELDQEGGREGNRHKNMRQGNENTAQEFREWMGFDADRERKIKYGGELIWEKK